MTFNVAPVRGVPSLLTRREKSCGGGEGRTLPGPGTGLFSQTHVIAAIVWQLKLMKRTDRCAVRDSTHL